MGLDMSLYKIEKVDGYSFEELLEFDEQLSEDVTKLPKAIQDIIKTIVSYSYGDTYRSLSESVGYWRKANQVHNWFVQNVQSGVDDCECYIVPKEQLEELHTTVIKILALGVNVAQEVLPTTDGFYFGGRDYDEYYFADIKETKRILEEVLEETDFEKEYIYYSSSW